MLHDICLKGAIASLPDGPALYQLEALEEEIAKIQQLKNEAVSGARYEEAARYRDNERTLYKQLDHEKELWEKESLKNRSEVGFDDIAQVISDRRAHV